MADLVGSAMTLASLLLAVVQAAKDVQSYKQQSKRLAARVSMLKDTMLMKASKSSTAEAIVRDLLLNIKDFLSKLQIKRPLLKIIYNRDITAQSTEFGVALNELKGDLDFCYNAQCTAENLDDARDDFEYAQIINTLTMPQSAAEQINKQLQLEAPPELRGFVEIDFNLLHAGRPLGEGSFGTVSLSNWSGMAVASAATVLSATATCSRSAAAAVSPLLASAAASAASATALSFSTLPAFKSASLLSGASCDSFSS
jgi:hypothetical protein